MRIPGLSKLLHLDRIILRLLYGFDSWHTQKPNDKKYVLDIISYINKNYPNKKSVVEIGAGLGDIIRRLSIENKLIIDFDINVLKACEFLSKFKNVNSKSTKFRKFDIIRDNLDEKYDIIIIVNFIHEISPEILNPKLQYIWINNLNSNGVMILDSVKSKHHMYNHNFNDIINTAKSLNILESYSFNRKIYICEKNQTK